MSTAGMSRAAGRSWDASRKRVNPSWLVCQELLDPDWLIGWREAGQLWVELIVWSFARAAL